MIRINELRITPDTHNLVIGASVRNLPYYDNIYIDSIVVDNQETYKDNGPSSRAYLIPLYDTVELTTEDFAADGNKQLCKKVLKVGGLYRFKVEDGITYEFVNNSTALSYSFEYEGEYLKDDTFKFTGSNLEIYNIKDINIVVDYRDLPYNLSNDLLFVYIKAKGNPTADTPCTMDNIYTLGITFNTCLIYNTLMQAVNQLNTTCSIPREFINYFLQFKAIEASINTGNYMQAIEYYNKFIKNDSVAVTSNNCNCYGKNTL